MPGRRPVREDGGAQPDQQHEAGATHGFRNRTGGAG
jgi:hypothetical protein